MVPPSRDRMLSSVWRTDDFGRLMGQLERYLPSSDLPSIRAAYEFSAKAHQGQQRRNGDPYISHPVAVAEILAGLHLDSGVDQGGAAARRHRGHAEHARRDPNAVRRRRGAARRRRQQDRPPAVRQRRRGASRELPQDAARDGEGSARDPREARRSHAQHAHDRSRCRSRSSGASRARRSTSTRRSRTGSACTRSRSSSRTSGSRPSIRFATRCSQRSLRRAKGNQRQLLRKIESKLTEALGGREDSGARASRARSTSTASI